MSAFSHRHRLLKRLTGWLAILAMSLNALWPLIANARPVSAGEITEICTANGMIRVAVGDGTTHSPDLLLAPHCSFCTFSADRAVAPPPPVVALIVPAFEPTVFRPRSVEAVVPESHSQPPAPPRAPPFSA